MKSFTITEAWLDAHHVDVGFFMEALEAAGIESMPVNGAWVFEAADASPDDGIPDFLANIIFEPVITNVSQGGDITN